MSCNLSPTAPDRVEQLFDSLAHRLNHACEAVQILQAVKACGIVGRVYNAGSVDRIEEYSAKRWRDLIVCHSTEDGRRVYADDHHFVLANKDQKRVTVERVDALLAEARKRVSDLSDIAAELPSVVAAYNAAAAYVARLWGAIRTAEIHSGVKTYG